MVGTKNIRLYLQTFNSLYGIRIEEKYEPNEQDFQFPLWDTEELSLSKAGIKAISFQFPLWDTYKGVRLNPDVFRPFQFPLWDTIFK